ncbi:MAG: hypothetical protein GY832_42015 [Chloroflexi bacterium]|nr:hypothetical protein [Chloroflexota bacterium]
MGEFKTRFMHPDDWAHTRIERGRHFNKEYAVTGYQRIGGQVANPLHPVCVFEDRLRETRRKIRKIYPGIRVSRHHVKMPYWNPQDTNLPNNYSFVETPERLTTTSITVAMVSHTQIQNADMGFHYDGQKLPTLRERIKDTSFQGLAGNLGYYMTKALIVKGRIPKAHNARYPEFPLPVILSYIGFYLFRDADTRKMYGSFQGAHPSAVGIRENGTVEIIPRLEIETYKVTLGGKEFLVNSINDPNAVDDVMLFTPGLWTPEISQQGENWLTYTPEIPIPDRVNVFVANEGNGSIPVEKVVKVWQGRAPIPSFGAVLSFAKGHLAEAKELIGQKVQVEPLGDTNFDDYVQIMGGFVPAVVEGQHIYCVDTVEQIRQRLHDHGNTISPIAECGKETRNFDPRIREPAGVLIQTKDQVGWVLFDGRHELSIGASVVDVAKILKMLEDDGTFDGKIKHAIFVDGGSAMKVYAVESDGASITLDLLNRVAAGSRNGPGDDPDGLNLYTLLKLSLK